MKKSGRFIRDATPAISGILFTATNSRDLSAVSKGLDMSWKLDGSFVTDKVVVEVDFHQIQVDLGKAIEALRKEQGLLPGEAVDVPRLHDPNIIDVKP